MLTQFLELLIITFINGVARLRQGGRKPPTIDTKPPADQIPEGHVFLGTTIPLTLVSARVEPDEDDDEEEDEDASSDTPTIGAPCTRLGQTVTLSPDDTFRHVLTLGATGSGKSVFCTLILRQLIAASRGICIIDPFGDYVDAILNHLAVRYPLQAITGRLALLDFRYTDQEHISCLNPLAGQGDAFSRALRLLEAIRRQHEDGLGVTIDETLRNSFIALAEAGDGTLLDLEPLLTVSAYRAKVLSRVMDSQVRAFFRRYDALSDERQAATAAAVLNKTTAITSNPALRLIFSQPKPAFDLHQLLDETPGAIVLVALAADQLPGRASYLIGSMFLALIEGVVLGRAHRKPEERLPVEVLCDEFGAVVTPQFEMLAAQGRRLKCGLILALQNLAQMPPSLRAGLRNNTGTKALFATGSVDAAELIADIATGETREAVRQTLLRQAPGQAFIVRRGKSACRIQVPFDEDPPADPAAVAALRAQALRTYGCPRTDVEQELAAREALLYPTPEGDTLDEAPGTPAALPGGEPSLEIREVTPDAPKKAAGKTGKRTRRTKTDDANS